MTITVKLFGAFRQYATENPIALELDTGVTAGQVRVALHGYARQHWTNVPDRLIDASAISTSSEVLRDADIVTEGELAILPPVSGG